MSSWGVPARRGSQGPSWRIAGSRSSGDSSTLEVEAVGPASSGAVVAGVVEEDSPCIRKSSEDGMEAADGAAENGNTNS